ncbi:uncharacterized protein LOC117760449 [Hippoglossus hippoglossus]|uniref:uncharacterized protein LOC117760449 n=1 Tax=Hippoglossus hippoglossus TaxID=8267 RepID=UPI00148D14DC|nr:uncharacterized protein LOC117760449 [Hippoglossus hippoglossus]
MGKERKTVRLETYEADTPLIIVGEVKISPPRMRDVKSKERIKKVTTSNKGTTTCETSGNVMKLCVNLMPVLAAAREEEEEEEEEEEKEEETSCTRAEEPKTSNTKDPTVTKLKQQAFTTSDSYAGLTNESKQSLNPLFVLPPITEPAPAPECCDHHRAKRFPTPLPPIGSSEKTTTTISPQGCTSEACGGDSTATGQVSDSRPWIDNVLFSKSRSAEFRLPDISLSSLDALLQTVTLKLARKRRGLGNEEGGPLRRVQSDHLLMTVSEQRLREKRVGQQIDEGGSATETSVIGHSVNRQRRLPPQPALILTMTKKNFPTYTMMQ